MRRTHLGILLLVMAIGGIVFASPDSASAAVCDDYSNQQEAQEAADTIDADSDGVYCESLPCPCLKPGSGGGGGGGGGGGNGGGGGRPPKPKKPQTQTIRSRVIKVTDGDTIKIRSLENTRKRFYDVRIIGIDTPEVYGGKECGGPQASASMKALAPPGTRVLLRTDTTQDLFDRYGRLLAYVNKGRADLGKLQVARGWAKPYVYAKRFRRLGSYRAAQRKAKRQRLGVYALCGGRF